jgi:hypothetical protein
MLRGIDAGGDAAIRVLECLLIARKIEVSNLTVVGDPVLSPFIEPVRGAARRTPVGDYALRRIGTALDAAEGGWRHVRVPADCAVHGFDFRTLVAFTELVVRYLPAAEAAEWEVEHFRLPMCPEHCCVMLPHPVEMKECRMLLIGGGGDAGRELSVKIIGPASRGSAIVQPRARF